jgi:hypothetical protein
MKTHATTTLTLTGTFIQYYRAPSEAMKMITLDRVRMCVFTVGMLTISFYGVLSARGAAPWQWRARSAKELPAAAGLATVTGTIAQTTERAIRRLFRVDRLVLIAMDSGNFRSCADLGRHAREVLSVAVANKLRVVIVTDTASELAIRKFIAAEKISLVDVVVTANPFALADGTQFATPAALLIDSRGTIVRGRSVPLGPAATATSLVRVLELDKAVSSRRNASNEAGREARHN